METSFKQTTSNKVERYRLFLPQFELLISDEKEEISVLANTAAALREAFGFFWVGFYLVKHISFRHKTCLFYYPVRKRRLAVIYMRYDAEIPDFILI